ncbi:Protein takeout [Frankliniella fusca]|uniref:Protein takeout n=1 Tax=Frankliniella fusca TaxID=407009 RepID=A0AAE1LD21_9NEOP|nr:Protein takeout [Frankliniella fusca]
MKCHILTAALLLLCAAGSTRGGKLPPNIKRCARTDPNVNECLRLAVQDALPKLRDGLPKLGLHRLDPLVIDELRISQGTGPINMDLTFTNMTTTKILDDVKVSKVRFDYDNLVLEATTITPVVLAKSKYSVGGRVLLLPIRGSGDSVVNLFDVTTDLVIKGKRITKADGKDYLDIQSVIAKLTPKRMEMKMENLFNGDKQLGETMNRVMNDNWQQVYAEVGPSFAQAYQELFKRPARALFLHVPIDDIYPQKL